MRKTETIQEPNKMSISTTIENTSIPIYDWMLDTGLHQADLLVYAAIFDILRHNPLEPQRINLARLSKRIHYTRQAVYGAVSLLTNQQFIFTQGEGRNTLFSIYPFETLDLK